MRAHRILGASIVVGTMVATFFQAGTASASGGGGCGAPVTEGRGDRVVIKEFCFGPTILRVHRGQEVTFKNRDGVRHTVLGANASWGSFRALQRGHDSVTYRFTETGVYPYVCTWHVGMIGAVVVGGGPKMVSGMATTAEGPVVKVDPSELQAAAAAMVPSPELVPPKVETAWPAIALALAATGGLAVIVFSRRRVRLPAA